jgi:DNA-binding protein HU-beta
MKCLPFIRLRAGFFRPPWVIKTYTGDNGPQYVILFVALQNLKKESPLSVELIIINPKRSENFMNKSQLIEAMANQSQLSKSEAGRALDALISAIEDTLKNGHAVNLVGFGSFEVKARAERKGRNPQTGAEITIAAANLPAFKAGKVLKDAVNA